MLGPLQEPGQAAKRVAVAFARTPPPRHSFSVLRLWTERLSTGLIPGSPEAALALPWPPPAGLEPPLGYVSTKKEPDCFFSFTSGLSPRGLGACRFFIQKTSTWGGGWASQGDWPGAGPVLLWGVSIQCEILCT